LCLNNRSIKRIIERTLKWKEKMGNKLFVGGISWNTDDNSLKAAFEAYGSVEEAKVITDRETGRSRGFGFVTMSSDSEAADAIAGLDGQELDGRTVRVNEAQERQRRDGGGGGGRRGGGGGGGGRW
jgi:cold-inducible RNA-binding protein